MPILVSQTMPAALAKAPNTSTRTRAARSGRRPKRPTPERWRSCHNSAPGGAAISPTFGLTGGGTEVTITGSNLTAETAVNFGTTRITPTAPTNNSGAIDEAPTQCLSHIAVHTVNDPNADPEDFFSPHTGVGMFLFGDGSVRPLREGLDLKVLQALATRNGGEVVSGSDY